MIGFKQEEVLAFAEKIFAETKAFEMKEQMAEHPVCLQARLSFRLLQRRALVFPWLALVLSSVHQRRSVVIGLLGSGR